MLLGFCLRGLSLGMRALYFRVDRSAPRAFLKVPAVRRCIDVAALQARSTPLACCKPGGGHRHRLRHLARLLGCCCAPCSNARRHGCFDAAVNRAAFRASMCTRCCIRCGLLSSPARWWPRPCSMASLWALWSLSCAARERQRGNATKKTGDPARCCNTKPGPQPAERACKSGKARHSRESAPSLPFSQQEIGLQWKK